MTEAEQPQPQQRQLDQQQDQNGAEAGADAGGARSVQPSRGLPPLPTISTVRVPSDPSVLPRRLMASPKHLRCSPLHRNSMFLYANNAWSRPCGAVHLPLWC